VNITLAEEVVVVEVVRQEISGGWDSSDVNPLARQASNVVIGPSRADSLSIASIVGS